MSALSQFSKHVESLKKAEPPNSASQMPANAHADEPDAWAGSAANAPAPAAQPADPSQQKVMGIQKALQMCGYDPGPIDGSMSPSTQAAIKKLQQANGLPADGRLNPPTQAALAKELKGRAAAAAGGRADGMAHNEAGIGNNGDQQLLDQLPKTPTTEIPGMNNGKVQALGVNDIPGIGKIKDKVGEGIAGDTELHIVITNKVEMPLRLIDGKVDHDHFAEFKPSNGPPAEIPAAKDGTPGKADIIVKTKFGLAGKLPLVTNADGHVEYEVHGDDNKTHLWMKWHRGNLNPNRKAEKKITPDTGKIKVDAIAGNDDVFSFIIEGEGLGAKKDSSDVSCRIKLINNSKETLQLKEAKNIFGDFATDPPITLKPNDPPAEFLYVQTPHEKDSKKVGCKGFLDYIVGSTSSTWHCEWENAVGEKNNAGSKVDPQIEGFSPGAIIDQGDENVPVKFTLTSEDTGSKKVEFTIGPFSVGFWNKLDKGKNLDKEIQNIRKQIPAETKADFEKMEIVTHGYASNTGPEQGNYDLSLKRADTVIAALKKSGIPDSVFDKAQPHGEWETEKPTDDKKQEKEDDNWRKVVLKVFIKG
jgi:outer membrane protein OmpA-like peptidoglycan-associated protein